MKKTIISLLALLMASMGATAQTISVAGDVEALASGETVSFNLHITGATDLVSLHFEVVPPSTFTVSDVIATPAWSAMFSHESGVASAISSSANAFNGEGDIATVKMTVPANTAKGSYPVTINNVRVNGTNYESTISFNIKVVERHTVTLDEDSPTAPADAENVNVIVKRTIIANTWSTICLPFAMTAGQVTAAFGNEVKVGDFTGCTVDDETEDVKVNFAEVTAIAANHPYIIKVKDAISEFTVEGVDIAADDAVVKKDKSGRKYNSFIGNYENGLKLEDGMLFLNGNKFYFSKGETTMKAFRAYFDLDAAGAYYGSRIALVVDETTGIGTSLINHEEWDNAIYNLKGQRVEKPGKGIYIVNGKKVKK